LKIWELGAAVAVDGEDKVSTDLIVDTCSNFFMVDAKGIVQLAHLSVREYLEPKVVDGRLIFSPEEAHAEAAFTCLTYWKNISQWANDEDEESEAHDDSQDGQDEEDAGASLDSHSTNWKELAQTISGEANQKDKLAHNSDHALEQAQADEEYRGLINQRKAEADDNETTEVPSTEIHPVKAGDGNTEALQIGNFFEMTDKYIRMDSAVSLKPHRAFRRFQRYASIYWATHCQAAKGPRTDESRSLYEIFWDFLDDDGSSPEFKLWEMALLNETKLTSVPIIDPAPMIFVPATAHERAILDAEPIYERWQETIAHFDGPQPLRPSVPLIACFYGFTDILAEISEDGSAQVTRNHEGLIGLVLAARNGYNEVLDLPISNEYDLDVADKGGRTALHHAALGGYMDLVRFLLGYPRKPGRRGGKKDRKPRANVNAKDIGERTPLHYAAESNKVDVVKLLLGEANMDVHARNHYGYTALGLCSHNKSEVAKLLRDDSRYKKEDEFGAFELEIKVELG
jgi:ankyrin repeat protein